MRFNKGEKVIVKASVFTKDRVSAQIQPCEMPYEKVREVLPKFKNEIPRPLRRMHYDEPFEGIIVGWSTRISGIHAMGSAYDDPGALVNTETHKVIMVQPLYTDRWVKPIPCLEEDLDLIGEPCDE